MKYRLAFKPRSEKDLHALGRPQALRVVEKPELLTDNLAGDVKKPTNFTPKYRPRVGDYRVLFQVVGAEIVVYRVVHRRDAYR